MVLIRTHGEEGGGGKGRVRVCKVMYVDQEHIICRLGLKSRPHQSRVKRQLCVSVISMNFLGKGKDFDIYYVTELCFGRISE